MGCSKHHFFSLSNQPYKTWGTPWGRAWGTGARSAHFKVGHLFSLSLSTSLAHCAMVRTLTLTNPTATIHRHIDRLHTTGARVLLTHTYRERERKREKEQNMIMVQKKLMMIMMAALLAACALATSATAMNTIPTNLVLRKLSQWGGEWSYDGIWGEWS